ncbi:MAG: phage holin family protein [Thermoleophilaceae bacterium]|nr:phage holin family protein [Thermoleophilaceae bacterium]
MATAVTYETRKNPGSLVRILATGVVCLLGLWVASLLDLVTYGDSYFNLVIAALVLAAANLFIRPVFYLLSLPFIVVTLGLFIWLINALMLWVTSLLVPPFDLFGFWKTIGAAFILWIANMLVGGIMLDFIEKPERKTYVID